ncbi:hypothetical protein [Schinkia azotoformans]|uniref:hypothetical protein n=1 Tax=Schinkia azotoformans TaxID=1454 RepID=UPI002DBE7E9B|nr:hypothetical protein [Schinkia azotoformans]MEC1759872.1 hypothetical protein [Schinkia azotoformans]
MSRRQVAKIKYITEFDRVEGEVYQCLQEISFGRFDPDRVIDSSEVQDYIKQKLRIEKLQALAEEHFALLRQNCIEESYKMK